MRFLLRVITGSALCILGACAGNGPQGFGAATTPAIASDATASGEQPIATRVLAAIAVRRATGAADATGAAGSADQNTIAPGSY